MFREITRCRICGNDKLVSILSLGTQSLTGVFPKTANVDIPAMPLELVKCTGKNSAEHCGLVQLRHTFQLDLLYGEHYGYRSALNKSMVNHLQGTANDLVAYVKPAKGDLIIDIGSNDSTFLQAYPRDDFTLLGIDPTGKKFRDHYPKYIQLIPEFFSGNAIQNVVGRQKAKVITSIAMFYDVEDPMSFMQHIYNVLDDNGVWFLEQSYMPTMLENNSYDTVCHEHLEYYSLTQIQWMAQRVGFKILDVSFNDTNGGSFSIIVAKQDSDYAANEQQVQSILRKEKEKRLDELTPYEEFKQRIFQHKHALREFLHKIKNAGQTIFGYGASTKGNVLLQFCQLTKDDIPCIAEVNEDKYGCVTPGSQIPIIAEKEARELRPDYFLVLPWHFRNSIISKESAYLKSKGHLLFPLPSIEVV